MKLVWENGRQWFSVHRFLVDPANIKDEEILLEGDDFKHLKQVLRLGPQDTIHVFDGSGIEYVSTIVSINENNALAKIESSYKSDTEPKARVTLFQGIPKGNKMDLIIQKTVELGVYKIVPIITERTVVKINEKDKAKKANRWSKIAKEAAKQCHRAYIPEVLKPIKFGDLSELLKDFDSSFLLYENESKKCLKEVLKCYTINKIEDISIIVGPEGGFTDQEIEIFRKWGHDTVGLGRRILRTETASISALSIIMYELGEMTYG